mmetsp:Transcript_626/g.1009  ORF Transcript_626/g.1009 Transcript_626/m.1009 type:complete len:221 (-) Transcript_626:333-995(-)|eukprot:CAMPEP_0170472188 /NCGR_PEP_ID=MMETSP0123-20130129/14262_1 /TAXON_ID=182087 /ORGANISM="Favella ehrenbergii, Strain Fehren 1" /LENGTH=220 /DNA_ID=CAMNT_0010740295 /DNA_START=421 /DNA_END=1083 /DNA_ORIENTATION=-
MDDVEVPFVSEPATNEEEQVAEDAANMHYEFAWKNVRLVALTQALPEVLDFFIISHTYHLASYGDLNDSYISCLFAMTSLYVAIIFYFRFGEAVSFGQSSGMALMVMAVVILTLDKGAATYGRATSQVKETKDLPELYQLLALAMGVIGPYLWTVKNYYIKIALTMRRFRSIDLIIDQYLIVGSILTVLYLAKLTEHEFNQAELLKGSLTGLCFFISAFC